MTVPDLLPVAVAAPLVIAAALPVLSQLGFKRTGLEILSILTVVAVLAIDLLLLVKSAEGPFIYWFGGWRPVAAFPIGISFLAEPAATGAATLAAVLTLAGLIFSIKHFDAYGTFFHSLLLAFLAAMSGFCLSADLFNQFVFFELMGVAAYALTGYKVEDTGPLEGGLNFAVVNSIGAIAILMGIGLVYGRTGSLNMVDVGRRLAASKPDLLVMAAMALFLSGYFVKSAIFPFHFWLPDAHAVAPTAGSVLFSGIMVETALIGGFRTMRWVFSPVGQDDAIGAMILTLGAGTAILGSVMALLQRHLKRLLAFSTISHSGIMLGALVLLGKQAISGCFVYIIGHGLAKGALFCCTGMILHRRGSVDELDLHGRCKDLRICAVLYFVGVAALLGMPPFATFAAKSLIDEGAHMAGCDWFAWIAAAATAVTSAAIIRAGIRMFFGLGSRDRITKTAPLSGSVEGRETSSDRQRTPATMWVPTALLLVLAVAAGSVPAVVRTSDASASLYLQPALPASLVFGGSPIGLPPGHALELKGKDFAVAFSTCAVAIILSLAFTASGRSLSRIMRIGSVLAKPLRSLHSGYIGDYATWFLMGMVLLLLVFSYQAL